MVKIIFEGQNLSFEGFLRELENCPDDSQMLPLHNYLMLRVPATGKEYYSPSSDSVMASPTRWGLFMGEVAYIKRQRGLWG